VNQFQFIADNATTVLQFVSLIASTYLSLKKVYDDARDTQNKARKETFAATWKAQLIEAGIPADKAEAIVSRFADNFFK
jgi:hypothetical protein